MADPNFTNILDRPSGEVERPKPFPQGSYVFVTRGLPRHDKSTKKGTAFSEYTCVCLQPLDDVDPEAVTAFGGVNNKTMKLTFYHTNDALYRLKDFLVKALEIDDEEGKKKVSTMESESVGIQFVGTVTQKPSDDGENMYSNITKTISITAYNEAQEAAA